MSRKDGLIQMVLCTRCGKSIRRGADYCGAFCAAMATLESQEAKHSKAVVADLVDRLLVGEKPLDYGERVVQMALQRHGFLPQSSL
jgi:hypothetical protein